jgi:hypothetical protein
MTVLQETFADVAALIPRYSWEIMDEEQKDRLMEKIVVPRYMETTADGVQLGPKTWAELLDTTAAAITNRVYRLNQAKSTVARAEPEWKVTARRHARQVLRESTPEQIADILSEPEVAANVTKAQVVKMERTIQEVDGAQKQRAPGLVHRSGFNDVAGNLLRAQRHYASALSEVRELDLDDDEREAISEIVAKIGVISGWFDSYLNSNSRGFDHELDELLKG